MCDLCDDDRVSVVIDGEMPSDEPDNVAMIARDLASLQQRWLQLPLEQVGGIKVWGNINLTFHTLQTMIESV